MITINLEKSLLKNKRGILSKEEKRIKDKIEAMDDSFELDEMRYKLGIWSDNMSKMSVANANLKIVDRFIPERVFQVNDIKELCCKYGLRFLPAYLFNGEMDKDLPNKIRKFELDYNMSIHRGNSYIVAPASSFKLQERPKDPLFFTKLSDDYYYLLHKWGNDISALRLISNFFIKNMNRFMSLLIIFSLIITSMFAIHESTRKISYILLSSFGISLVSFGILFIISMVSALIFNWDLNEDIWNKPYKN